MYLSYLLIESFYNAIKSDPDALNFQVCCENSRAVFCDAITSKKNYVNDTQAIVALKCEVCDKTFHHLFKKCARAMYILFLKIFVDDFNSKVHQTGKRSACASNAIARKSAKLTSTQMKSCSEDSDRVQIGVPVEDDPEPYG